MKKQILCLALLLCSVLAIPPAASGASPNCHELARQWFGASLLAVPDPASPEAAADAWFTRREENFRDSAALREAENPAVLLDAEPDGTEYADPVSGQDTARLAGIADFQTRAELTITDADVTAQADSGRTRTNPDGTITMYVYEWTFLDYDDLTDGIGGSDVMGFGTWHKLTLSPAGDGWTVTRDEYDETDLLGVCTVTEETRAEPEAAALLSDSQFWPESEAEKPLRDAADGQEEPPSRSEEDGEAALMAPVDYYPGYNPDAASAYADKYAISYNPAFPNYNPVGGDCANFTSQCIYYGGMPMVSGNSGWYHELGSTSVYARRSGSWTMARDLYDWMSANRGLQLTAADDTVIKGSPVFYVNRGKTAVGHAAICVGTNSAGRPIVDSHNSDKYHAPWDYSKGSPAIYTVQLTGGGPVPLSVAGERAPSGKLGVGTGFGLRGVIRSDAIVTHISADILDADGIPLQEYHYETAWDDYRYDIRINGLNDAMVFDTLKPGTYTYVVYAEDAEGAAETLIRSPFTVAESSITITDETRPSGTLKKGNSFTLKGIIQSSLPLTKITAAVAEKSTGRPVSDRFAYERNWSSETYNIRGDGVNSALVFNNLPAGSYVYTVSATDAAGTAKTLIEAPFSVSAFSGTPEAPSVTADGAGVTFTWTLLSGTMSWRAVLSDPETGETRYELTNAVSSANRQSCVLSGVSEGTYDAFVEALAGEESVQSPAVRVRVNSGGENGGNEQGETFPPDVTIERATRRERSMIITALITFDWEERGDAVLAVAAYREGRLLCCELRGEIMGQGQTSEKVVLRCPEETPFDTETTVRVLLLDKQTLLPLAEAVEPVFPAELTA